MSHTATPPLFDRCSGEVEQMAMADASFGDVEQTIWQTGLPSDQQAALWLLAWSLIGPEDLAPAARRSWHSSAAPDAVAHQDDWRG